MSGRPRRGGDSRYDLVAELPNGKLSHPVETPAGLLRALEGLAPLVPHEATWYMVDHGPAS